MKRKEVEKAVEVDAVTERILRLEALVEKIVHKLNQVPQCGERIERI